MKTVRSKMITALATGIASIALMGTAVHAGSGGDAAGQSAGMGMMQHCCPMMGERRGMSMMRGESPMAMMGGMQQVSRIMHELELTDAQRSELRELRHRHREAQFERMARMKNQRDDIHALIAAEEPDPERVLEQHARAAEIHGEMLAEDVRFRNSMRELLTEEQRRELKMEPSDEEEHADHH